MLGMSYLWAKLERWEAGCSVPPKQPATLVVPRDAVPLACFPVIEDDLPGLRQLVIESLRAVECAWGRCVPAFPWATTCDAYVFTRAASDVMIVPLYKHFHPNP
jgi:hypothetical protein